MPDSHAVYLDIIDRVRRLFARVTVVVAVNGAKQPAHGQADRASSPPAGTTSRSPRGRD